MLCKVEGCDREARYKRAQLCQCHYFRVRRNGTTDLVRRAAKLRQETPQGYQWIYSPGHPLGHKTGYVAEHRAILYADLGEGPLACEMCAKPLTWKTCHVDHIDNNPRNNDRANLRPTCSVCNTRRGMRPPVEWNRTRRVEYAGTALTPHEWSRDERVQVNGATIRARLKKGMTHEQALFSPKKTHNGRKKEVKGPPKPHIPITFAGKTLTASEWTREEGVTVSDVTIRNRIRKGWDAGAALFMPATDLVSTKQKLKEMKANT